MSDNRSFLMLVMASALSAIITGSRMQKQGIIATLAEEASNAVMQNTFHEERRSLASAFELSRSSMDGVNASSNVVVTSPCDNETLVEVLKNQVQAMRVDACTQLGGGQVADVYSVSLTTVGNSLQRLLIKSDSQNANEVWALTELAKVGFPHMAQLKAIIPGTSAVYIVTEFLASPWTTLMDFLFSRQGPRSFTKAVQMTWEGALKGFQLIVKAITDMHRMLPSVSHCDLHSGNVMVRGEQSQGRFDDVKLIDFGMASKDRCERMGDFQRLQVLFFQMLADVNPAVQQHFVKWQHSFNDIENDKRPSEEVTQEYKSEVSRHDRGGMSVTYTATTKWWEDEDLRNCALCRAHANQLGRLFEGEIGSVVLGKGIDASKEADYTAELHDRLQALIKAESKGAPNGAEPKPKAETKAADKKRKRSSTNIAASSKKQKL